MKKRTVVFIESGLILGIFVSVFLVPRSLPIKTFALIAASIFLASNALLLSRKNAPTAQVGYRMTARAYFALGLMVLYWVTYFLWR